jgi:hypothetical protein
MARARKPNKVLVTDRACAHCGQAGGALGAYRSMMGHVTAVHVACHKEWLDDQREELMNMSGGCAICGGRFVGEVRTTAQFRMGAGNDKWVHAHCALLKKN